MSKKILTIGSFVLTFFCQNYLVLAAEENPQEAQPTPNQYPQELVDGFMSGCVRGASQKNENGEGLSEEVANSLCSCTIDRFQAKYPLEEFLQLIEAAQKNGDREAANKLNETTVYCASEVLGGG
jgi:hypothetical protein